MIDALLKNLNQDIALLQRRIEIDKGVGFNDMARLLEAMSIQLFKGVGIAHLASKNQIRVNFPAIDAADDDRAIAVQVTSVADAAKIKKTIATFESKDRNGNCLKDRYSTLYIFGFCKASKATEKPSYCHVIDPSFLLNRLIDLNDETRIESLIDSIRRHVSYASLHPYDDINCLKIVLGYVARNAVRQPMRCEGNERDMMKGLNEISELIGKGTVNGRERSKAHHEFNDPDIGVFLRHVLSQIGAITAIMNHARRDGFVYLDSRAMSAIDEKKRAIASSAQSIAKRNGIDIDLSMYEVR